MAGGIQQTTSQLSPESLIVCQCRKIISTHFQNKSNPLNWNAISVICYLDNEMWWLHQHVFLSPHQPRLDIFGTTLKKHQEASCQKLSKNFGNTSSKSTMIPRCWLRKSRNIREDLENSCTSLTCLNNPWKTNEMKTSKKISKDRRKCKIKEGKGRKGGNWPKERRNVGQKKTEKREECVWAVWKNGRIRWISPSHNYRRTF